jgi:hypothetical protein
LEASPVWDSPFGDGSSGEQIAQACGAALREPIALGHGL